MPGPSGTESRWAPTTTWRSTRPVLVVASRFAVGTSGTILVVVATRTVTVPALTWLYNSSPIAKLVPITGIVDIVGGEGAGERLIAAGLTFVEDDRRVVPARPARSPP